MIQDGDLGSDEGVREGVRLLPALVLMQQVQVLLLLLRHPSSDRSPAAEVPVHALTVGQPLAGVRLGVHRLWQQEEQTGDSGQEEQEQEAGGLADAHGERGDGEARGPGGLPLVPRRGNSCCCGCCGNSRAAATTAA